MLKEKKNRSVSISSAVSSSDEFSRSTSENNFHNVKQIEKDSPNPRKDSFQATDSEYEACSKIETKGPEVHYYNYNH